MEKYDSRIDEYIGKSAEFAKPILIHLRKLIHQASPQISETIKWGFPHFDYKGTVCSMASFKQHCAFGFWKSSLLKDDHQILQKESSEAMGQFGRIQSLSDLPDDEIILAYLLEATDLNEKGIKVPKKALSVVNTNIEVPDFLLEKLDLNPQAKSNFFKFSPSHRKEYINWLTEAKTEATRTKRLATAIEWLTEGKGRNWKYDRQC
ncbi:MAG TPA: YdeI/OmpD-associated family protein [Pedobacter sp.]|jgi:uncharacterized protein YdeI (YjbR/CyaY-like superfamily)